MVGIQQLISYPVDEEVSLKRTNEGCGELSRNRHAHAASMVSALILLIILAALGGWAVFWFNREMSRVVWIDGIWTDLLRMNAEIVLFYPKEAQVVHMPHSGNPPRMSSLWVNNGFLPKGNESASILTDYSGQNLVWLREDGTTVVSEMLTGVEVSQLDIPDCEKLLFSRLDQQQVIYQASDFSINRYDITSATSILLASAEVPIAGCEQIGETLFLVTEKGVVLKRERDSVVPVMNLFQAAGVQETPVALSVSMGDRFASYFEQGWLVFAPSGKPEILVSTGRGQIYKSMNLDRDIESRPYLYFFLERTPTQKYPAIISGTSSLGAERQRLVRLEREPIHLGVKLQD